MVTTVRPTCYLFATAIALSAGLARADESESAECRGQQLGTSITWYQDDDAFRLAKEQQKLVFVIQVSGNFALEEFT